ncbi:MAG: hypothetical protein HY534_01650 [Chloroflexi bacterium]|nr:hypothetical protein [Chloroflexota bacterium]
MEHQHHHEHHEAGGAGVARLEFIVREVSPTEALVRYDCPCGCKPSTEYVRDSAESDHEHCCCGNVHFVGPNARADLDQYLAERRATGEDDDVGGYDIHEETLAAPWGGQIPVVYGLPHRPRKH